MDSVRLRKDFAACGKIEHVKVPFNEKGQSLSYGFITFKTKQGVDAALSRTGDKTLWPGRTLKVTIAKAKPASAQSSLNSKVRSQSELSQIPEEASKQKLQCSIPSAPMLGAAPVLDMALLGQMARAQASEDFSTLEVLATNLMERARAAQAFAKLPLTPSARQDFTVIVRNLPFSKFDLEKFRKDFASCGEITDLKVHTRSSGKTNGSGTITFRTQKAFHKALAHDGTERCGRIVSVVDAAKAGSPAKNVRKTETQESSNGLLTPEAKSKRKGESDNDTSPAKVAKKDVSSARSSKDQKKV